MHKKFLLGMFDGDEHKAIRQYKNFVKGQDSVEVTNFFYKKNLASFFGSQNFIEWVKSAHHQLQNQKEIPHSRYLAPTIDNIIVMVYQHYQVEQRELRLSRRGQTNEPRNVAVYLARKRCGLRLEEIGRTFEILSYSSVSSIVTRMEKQLSTNKQLLNKVEEIILKLNKSHAKI